MWLEKVVSDRDGWGKWLDIRGRLGPVCHRLKILTYRWWGIKEEPKASQEGSDLHFKNTALQVSLEDGLCGYRDRGGGRDY